MLINQGNGVFPKTAILPTWQRQGQHISPIDFDLDGKTDFIVLNGFGGFEGSVQLIKFPCKTLPDSCYGIRVRPVTMNPTAALPDRRRQWRTSAEIPHSYDSWSRTIEIRHRGNLL